MKRFIFLSLSVLLLLVIIPGCATLATTPPAGQLPVIGAFSSNPSAVNSGNPAVLFWKVIGATSVSIDQGIGQVELAGVKVVSPAKSTVYTITATNSAGTVTGSAVTNVNTATLPPVTVLPVISTFSSNPSAINSGSSSVLFWNVTGATSISIDQGIGRVDFTGIKVVSPAVSTIYTLSAVNSTGTVAKSAITVVNTAPVSPAPVALNGISVGVVQSESGSLVKSGRTYSKFPSICVGDNGRDLASRAFLSYDVSWIPSNAIIDEVVLSLGGYTSTGLPTYTDPVYGPQYGNFGALEIYRVQYGTYADLDTLTYNDPGELVASGKITDYPLVSPWSLAIKDPASGKTSVQGLVKAGQSRFQLRMQFFTSTNWNGVADTLCFDKSTLMVKYHLP